MNLKNLTKLKITKAQEKIANVLLAVWDVVPVKQPDMVKKVKNHVPALPSTVLKAVKCQFIVVCRNVVLIIRLLNIYL